MGVMEHHSMESGHVVEHHHSTQPMVKSATVGGFSANRQGVPSGGLCGPLPPVSTGAPTAKTETSNEVDHGGQTYTGTAAARMLSGSVSEGGVHVSRSVKDHGKAFPFSITAGVEKGDKNRCGFLVICVPICLNTDRHRCMRADTGTFGLSSTPVCAFASHGQKMMIT